jgi:hypothetical protein
MKSAAGKTGNAQAALAEVRARDVLRRVQSELSKGEILLRLTTTNAHPAEHALRRASMALFL